MVSNLILDRQPADADKMDLGEQGAGTDAMSVGPPSSRQTSAPPERFPQEVQCDFRVRATGFLRRATPTSRRPPPDRVVAAARLVITRLRATRLSKFSH